MIRDTNRSALNGCVRLVHALSAAEQKRMYELLSRYFACTSQQQFTRDLHEKAWAILLHDQAGHLQGFSTLMRLDALVEGAPVVAFFSGDTIIERDYWGETALPRLWAQHVFGLAEALGDLRAYWFLISSGYKTYRFLPIFFRSFYPTYSRPTPPALQGLLDTFGQQKFADEYDPKTGVVRLRAANPLRPDVAAIGPERLRDPHVAFFTQANPGHLQGDELACITELTEENLTPAGRRMLRFV